MTNTQDACRRAFEKKWQDCPALVPLDKNDAGMYICIITAVAWDSWQAAWSSRPQPNVEELVREIEGCIGDSSKGNLIHQGRQLAYNEGLRSAIALIRKWAEGKL